MTTSRTRRDILMSSLALAGLGAFGVPEWVLPALAQNETLVEFLDLPDNMRLVRGAERRIIDIRNIDGVIYPPADQFATTQHYGHPVVDGATYRLHVSGLVNEALSLSLDDLRAMPSKDLVFGFECSGNGGPVNGLCGNGSWTGVPLRTVLDKAGVSSSARDVVFFGADRGEEEVPFRGTTFPV